MPPKQAKDASKGTKAKAKIADKQDQKTKKAA